MPDRYFGDNLIFIISQPRSGSTLLQRVLSGHPDIQTSAETWLMLHLVYATRESGIQTEYGADWAQLALNDFLENYTDGPQVYDDAIRAAAQVLYGNALEKSGGSLFIDKTPRYALIIPDLYRLFPNAKFIFLLRNPLAVLASELTSHVGGNWPLLSTFQSDLLDAPQRIIEGIELLGDDAITVHYEYFVQQPEYSAAALCEELGVSFDAAMLDYANTPAAKGFMTDRVGIQQHTRPNPISIDKWKNMLGDPQQLHFANRYLDALGRDLIEKMGYPYDEFANAVREASARAGPDEKLFPWTLAIRPPSTWTGRERSYVRRYNRVRDHGWFAGNVLALADLAREASRRLMAAIRRAI